jgi:hypothetical protein
LAEPGFGARVDVGREGNVLGLELLAFEEYAELVTRFGGTLEIPERVEDSPFGRLFLQTRKVAAFAEAHHVPDGYQRRW